MAPMVATYCPAGQRVHGEHAGELMALLKRPEGHEEQVRSLVGEPAAEMNCPGMQRR